MRFVNSAIRPSLGGDAVIVTPSPLLAAVIQRQFAQSHVESGRMSWRTASVFSISAWMRQTWRELRSRLGMAVPGLLSPAQEQVLWQDAIRESNESLFDVAATAQSARRVARAIAEWGVPVAHPAWGNDQDAETYLRWWTSVRNRCREQNWMCAPDVWEMFSDYIPALEWPKTIVFAGFTDPVPALRTLGSQLIAKNVDVVFTESEAPLVSAQILSCGTGEEEFDFAARWARSAYERDSSFSVGLLVPELRSRRSAIERSLRDVFYPSAVIDTIGTEVSRDSVFHLHAGRSLREHPVVATALRILHLGEDEIPLASASALLRSPFLRGGVFERGLRSASDGRLRSLRETHVTFDVLEEKTVPDAAVLRSLWKAVRTVLAQRPHGSADPTVWSRFISALLKAVGWPGDAELNPLEQAATEQWREALSTLGSLGLTSGAVSWIDAQRLLKDLLSVDGPVTGDLQSPIQVLDPADAGSIQFDRAWTVGLSDGEWPQLRPSPPFVPNLLQRLHHMPSTPEGRQRQSMEAVKAFHQSAQSVFGSYSGEGLRKGFRSPYIKDFVLREADQISLWTGKALLQRIAPVTLEEVDDTRGPALQIEGAVTGGSYLIKGQSTCPFRAFTESRFSAREWDEGIFAFDQRDRGTFIHHAFAMFWQEVETSDKLHRLSAGELARLIEDVAARALAEDQANTTFREQLRKAEQERIGRVLHAWLEIEKRRSTPFRVLETEAKRSVMLAGLPLDLRIDRIDELADGGLLVIDYKSGSPLAKDLDGERPKEPQLLVYATALGSRVKGIYFGRLQARNEQAIGHASEAYFGGSREKSSGNWDKELERWKQLVHGLAQEFVSGYALATPDSKTCNYCAIKPVCRIGELNRLLSTGEGDE